MKSSIANWLCGLAALATSAPIHAQTTWNYFISDAGGGNSLVTWNVTGSLATPGSVRVTTDPTLAVFVNAPGIYTDSYTTNGTPQLLPTPDGSYFQYDNTSVFSSIQTYDAYNAPSGGNDTFGLSAPLFGPHGAIGITLLYNPGTQSAVIPIDFSDFNPGTYQSQQSGFDTPLTVNLTIGPVPEPSALALFALGGLSGLMLLRPAGRSYEKAQPDVPADAGITSQL
jgi:hypothetical protein